MKRPWFLRGTVLFSGQEAFHHSARRLPTNLDGCDPATTAGTPPTLRRTWPKVELALPRPGATDGALFDECKCATFLG